MRRKKQLLRSLPSLNERELTLVWRDIRRAADVAAIGGASSKVCDNYIEVGHVIERECEKRFGKKPEDYSNREGSEELPAIYKKVYSKKKARRRMKYLLMALSLLVVECDIDNPDLWEYQVCAPKDTSPQDLVAIENCLRSNGYKRVRIMYSCFDGNIIYATRKENKEDK